MSDYRLELKIKNNALWSVMTDAGYKSVAELSRASGVHQRAIWAYTPPKVTSHVNQN